MITCERCGKVMPDNAAICPSCGTISFSARPGMMPPTAYGGSAPESANFGEPLSTPEYNQGYTPQQMYPRQQGYAPQGNAYPPPYATPPQVMYQPVSVNVNMSAPAPSNNGSVVVEVLLSMFLGIYGVGWLMAGETTTGVVLLVCSFFLYWPIMVLGIIFTLGFGVLCLGPLAIGAIIVNAILLSNALKKKMQPPVYIQAR